MIKWSEITLSSVKSQITLKRSFQKGFKLPWEEVIKGSEIPGPP